MKTLRGHLTYANVMVTILAFIVLGGVAYAAGALPKDSVGTKQLKNGAVTAAKVKEGSLTGAQIASSTLGTVPHSDSAARAEGAGEAENSKLLQGHSASNFLGAGATAANSAQLGGQTAASYLGAPVTVRTETEGGFQSGSGDATVAARCENHETAVSGGFRETGSDARQGLGFASTFQLLASGPAVQGEEAPMPASAGQTPIGWYIELHYDANGSNPEVLVYVDCVPNRGSD
ncbi:MAG: hypothetical protein WB507_02545 [Solirubrobacterales bacterium]